MNFPSHIKVYIVGGYVRDRLLGLEGKDHDFVVVGATPQEMLDLGFQQVGADFPVFLHPQTGDEFALARTERKVGAGYNGFEVDFDTSVTLEEDLVRRDLTINAMAREVVGFNELGHAKLDDKVIDPFGGRLDLEARTLRHVSEAFAEDPVRVLRVARFAARYGFNIAISTVALMIELVDAGELDALTPERVWAETEKALNESNPLAYFRTLAMCGASDVLFPELDVNPFLASSLNSTVSDPVETFALVCLEMTAEQVNGLCDRLKVPNQFRQLALRSLEFVNLLRNDFTAEQLVDALYSVRAFQDKTNFEAVLNVASFSAYNSPRFLTNTTNVAAVAPTVLLTGFSDLPESKQMMKGAAVGEAVRRLRVNTADEQLRRQSD